MQKLWDTDPTIQANLKNFILDKQGRRSLAPGVLQQNTDIILKHFYEVFPEPPPPETKEEFEERKKAERDSKKRALVVQRGETSKDAWTEIQRSWREVSVEAIICANG